MPSPEAGLPSPDPGTRQATLRRAFDALHAGHFEAAWHAAGGSSGLDAADLEASLLAGLALGGHSARVGADGAAAPAAPGVEGASARELAERSAAVLSAVAAMRPQHAHPCLDLLGLLRRQRLQNGYAPVLHACLARAPDDPRLRRALAELQHDDGDDAGALDTIAAWLALRPGDEAALGLRGTVLVSLGRAEAALAQFRALAARSPGTARHWTNLGNTLRLLGHLDEAVPALRRAAELAPRDGQMRLNHAVALLHAGRLDAGWREYEARLSLPGHTALPHARLLPALAALPGGPAALRGRRVLCTHEEGFGDTLQFARFLPMLAAAGAHVVAQAPAPLVRLLRSLGPGIEVIEDGAAPPAWDWHCPMLSLPRVFGTTLDTIPSATPYLHAHPAAILAAEARLMRGLGAGRALRVGLAWAGQSRPWQPGFAAIDRRRSIGLAALAPLGALPGVALVGLQFGPEAAQAGTVAGLALHDGVADARDFADTAAVVACLDVIVSVDTAMVHLAGALGRPVLMLDRFDACWRWLHGREDSPWYPGLRIVRQERPGDWGGVVGRVVEMLRDMAAAREQGRPEALPLDSAQGSP
ncbi:MAG: tetratricopeptide repeat protein [Janthinobacterium lividum]